MVLTCNDKPELPPDDEGTWRRVVLVEYKSKFRHDPLGTWMDYNNNPISIHQHRLDIENNITTNYWSPMNNDNPQFPIDESVNENFNSWAEPFMSYLIKVYQDNKHIDLREPDEVKEYTKKYREANQHFKDFLNDKVIFDNNCNSIIRLETLYNEYRIWYRDNNGNGPQQKKSKDLKAFMEREYSDYWEEGVPVNQKGYRGIIVVSQPQQNKDNISENLEFIEQDDILDNLSEDEEKSIEFKNNINKNKIENYING